jgi:hypothetical protein
MKKGVILFVLALLVLILFACDFNLPPIPTAIEITGSPSVRFAEKVNMMKMFTDMFDEKITEDEKMTVFTCEQAQYFTYLIHMELLNEEFEDIENEDDFDKLNLPGTEILFSDIGGELSSEKVLIDGTKERTIFPLSEMGSLLTGFEFSKGYETRLYFSGSTIVEKSKIDIIIEEVDIVNDTENYTIKESKKDVDIENEKSDIEDWQTNGYNGTSYPSKGVKIDVPINGKDIAVSYKVYVPKGGKLLLSDFKNGNIKVEVVVWLPFVFKAVSEAEIVFPDDSLFSSKDDLFGRDEPDAENVMTDIIENLSLEILFDNNPFKGSDLIVWSGDNIEIINSLNDNSFPLVISEENMKKINSSENWPFTPNFKMRFPPDSMLRFPKEFNAVEFILKAKIKYRIDF